MEDAMTGTFLARRLGVRIGVACMAAFTAVTAQAFQFGAIEGGTIDLDSFRGQPVLVVNTASMCAFTGQYEALQALHEQYSDAGLVVLAVPSDDFRQELGSEAEVKEFCDVNFGLTLPMTEITSVRGGDAHPFYRWLADTHGFTPRWNFNKVLLSTDGDVIATFGSGTAPNAREVTDPIEAMLTQ